MRRCVFFPIPIVQMSPTLKSGTDSDPLVPPIMRSRVVRERRSVLAEFGVELSDSISVRVHDSTAELRYTVLPQRPQGTEGWNEEQLASQITRD